MSETRERQEKDEGRRLPSPVWPLLLIAAGVLFLLDNLGYANISVWQLWRLWPVLIILAGLNLLIGRRSRLGNLIALIVSLLVIGAVIWLVVGGSQVLTGDDRGGEGAMRIAEPLDGAAQASLALDFPAGTLRIDRQAGGGSLIEGTLDLAGRREPEWSVTRTGSLAATRLGYPSGQAPSGFSWGRGDEWTLHLAPEVTWDLDTNLGAGQAYLDLSGLTLGSLTVNAGAGETTVVLPREGDMQVSLKSGVGTLVLEIPESMAVRLRANRGLAPLSVSSRYHQQGDLYVAGNWESADSRVDVTLDMGVGAITIREP